MDCETIKMEIPANPDYVSILRLTTSGIANKLGFSMDDIEDMKVAVSEACSNAVKHSEDNKVSINFNLLNNGIQIEIIDNGNASYKEAFFDYQLVGNPYLFVLLKLISSIFFILTVINIALLSAKLCKNKKPETMFLTFLLVNVFNILLHLIVYELIGKNFGDDISKYTYLMNFYEGYVIENNIITSLINSFIYLILSIIPLKFIFKRR